jgi:hypothetical protein
MSIGTADGGAGLVSSSACQDARGADVAIQSMRGTVHWSAAIGNDQPSNEA